MLFNHRRHKRFKDPEAKRYCFGKSDAPAAPNYQAAAQATAQGNLESARATAAANRVNQVTPYGSITYSQKPQSFDSAGYQAAMDAYNKSYATAQDSWNHNHPQQNDEFGVPIQQPTFDASAAGLAPPPNSNNFYSSPDSGWQATTTLSPAQQQILDLQNQTNIGLSNLANTGLGYVGNMMANPFPQNALPASPINAGQTAQDAIMAREQPMLARERSSLNTQLLNQGLAQNSEAYNNSMDAFNRQANDAYQQAGLAGINAGEQARQQAIQEQSFFRNEPINTLNAVRSGAQINAPTFTNVPSQQYTAGPDLVNAATQGYQANVNSTNVDNANTAQRNGTIATIATIAAMY